jgi:hypothetical protein
MMANIDTSAEAVARVLNGVTDGPWHCHLYKMKDGLDSYVNDPNGVLACLENPSDARFIAAARQLVPALSADLETMRAERQTLLKHNADPAAIREAALREVLALCKDYPYVEGVENAILELIGEKK